MTGANYTLEMITKGDDVIRGFDFISAANADEILFSERTGVLRLYYQKTKVQKVVSGAPVSVVKGQGGLLDVMVHHGKILRITPDGKAEIWTSGHRNPQGLAFDVAGNYILLKWARVVVMKLTRLLKVLITAGQ